MTNCIYIQLEAITSTLPTEQLAITCYATRKLRCYVNQIYSIFDFVNKYCHCSAQKISAHITRITNEIQPLNHNFLSTTKITEKSQNVKWEHFTIFYFGAIIHSLSILDAVFRYGWFRLGIRSFQMLHVYWWRKRSLYFSDIPALKLGRYFTGIAAETAAAIFPVKCR